MGLRTALVKKEAKLHLQNGDAVLNDVKRLIGNNKYRKDNTNITVNCVLIKKIQQMRQMEANLPKAEY
jgi:hypothetical protein